MEAKVLIVGATNGLGLELAQLADEQGMKVVGVGRKFDGVNRRVEQGETKFANTFFVSGDVAKPDELLVAVRPHLDGVTHLFLVAGNFSLKSFKDLTHDEIDALYDVHQRGPRKFLNAFHRLAFQAKPLADSPGQPYHLVMIGSTSSWRMRENEALYCEVQAGKAQFTRQFSVELARDLPGSKTTLVCPAGIATGFFKGIGVDTSKFMNPRAVAEIIWAQVLHQVSPFQEMHILRTRDGESIVNFGQKMPEAPNFGAPKPPKPEAPPIHLLKEGDTRPLKLRLSEMPPKPEPRKVHRAKEGEVDPKKIDPKDFGC